MTSKRCTKCGLNKLLGEFHAEARGLYGRKSVCKECCKAWRRGQRRRHYEADRERVAEQGRRWRAANRERVREAERLRYAANPEKNKEKSQRQHAARRERVFAHYGTACACCGATENLSIDHMAGNGADHRERLYGWSREGGGFYSWLIQQGFPEGYQVLCIPCNSSKGRGAHCRLSCGMGTAPEPRTGKWPTAIRASFSDEMKRELLAARVADGIEVSARLRAMAALWQSDPQLRVRVDELARTLR